MNELFDAVEIYNYQDDLLRNIKSIQISQELFDDLSDNPLDWERAKLTELQAKPPQYSSMNSIIHRPFEEALFFQSIAFPFDPKNWTTSRYADGDFGVWYGALELETTIFETVYHWRRFLQASQFEQLGIPIIGERRVFKVACQALLFDFRKKIKKFPLLVDQNDYSYAQNIGKYIQAQGHPGLLSKSARCNGTISAIFTAKVLSNPRDLCYLSYNFDPLRNQTVVKRNAKELFIL